MTDGLLPPFANIKTTITPGHSLKMQPKQLTTETL